MYEWTFDNLTVDEASVRLLGESSVHLLPRGARGRGQAGKAAECERLRYGGRQGRIVETVQETFASLK